MSKQSNIFLPKYLPIILILVTITAILIAEDNVHFYHAARFNSEPHLVREEMSSLELWIDGGKTSKSYDACGDKVPLLSLWGNLNIRELAKGAPSDLIAKSNSILKNLWTHDPSSDFGNFAVDGTFSDSEGGFNLYQNFHHGLFLQFYLPIRHLKLTNISYIDLTPAETPLPDTITPAEWLNFRSSVASNIEQFGVDLTPMNATGVGDLSLEIGWANSYIKTNIVDFIDTDIRLGLLFPTGAKAKPNQPFSMSLGYDGFWGFPVTFKIACGLFEWLTFGSQIDALFFNEATRSIRMKTDCSQSGPIKLACGTADVQHGAIWNTGVFFKSDHMPCGFSLLLGYNYNRGDSWVITPANTNFDYNIVNSDPMFGSWHMHTFNVYAEYDFSYEKHPSLPIIGFNVDHILGGKRIFNTTMQGTSIGINFIWCF